ncbi:MAG: hypothetical protein A2855_00305 [Candidatus Liptonbacteria bacterium RIFCSPHIGHO2_01_FULL_57_28]|uniref:DUF3899 domain-containing protein n=1 Tax=Candidatus Liptonbacteria bacterium RIFCSPHIGHO2_01_FULL_57_28 TaxID=1798647 RepID=A0A1G2C916_9BACT|nr:MAG: hypothetical protein A2855_00305 [Candidatus Liptonbacteria bacterium RIFCSPHIGHO2_01_FULL_57_28]
MKSFPSWLISIAAVGLGFFAFVITYGVLTSAAGRLAVSAAAGMVLLILIILIGIAAGYAAARQSRHFMLSHISRQASSPDLEEEAGPSKAARNRRVTRALFFAGVVFFLFFLVFIFSTLSSIINA